MGRAPVYPPPTLLPALHLRYQSIETMLFGTGLSLQYCDIRDFIVSYIHIELLRYWDIMIGGKYTANRN